MKKIAAIDIGSNGIRYSIAQVDQNGNFELLSRERLAVRLGTDAFKKHNFSKATKEQLLQVFAELEHIFQAEDIVSVSAIATAAFRAADNGEELAQAIFDTSAIKIQIIDGLHEAKLVHAGVASEIDLREKNSLIVDIGGGSLELIAVKDGQFSECSSFDLGTVRLLKLARAGKDIEEFLNEHEKDIKKFIKKHVPAGKVELIATGGNTHRLGKLRKKFYEKQSNQKIRVDEMVYFHNDLIQLTPKEREEKYELREDRAEVITHAIEILLLVVNLINVDKIRLPKVGLIDGIFKEMLQGK